jgi:hypothetical protein
MLQGIRPTSIKDYFRWGLQVSCEHYERWFDHGVRDLFVSLIRSTQAREKGAYGQGLIPLTIELFADLAEEWSRTPPPFALRTFGDSDFPELAESLALLRAVTARPTVPRLWWTFAATSFGPYAHALAALSRREIHTQAEAIAAIYDPYVAPCRMYVAFGKPMITAELQPPFLIDEAQAMWYQMPGYRNLSPPMIRRMIYETVYLRPTWTEDKGSRYESVLDHRATWEQPLVLGFGKRLAGFWYPATSIHAEGVEQ